jgi:short-subunit dehydrogenase
MNIVITGASKGFGKAIAEKFAGDKQGHTILICARDEQLLSHTRRELQGRFPRSDIKHFTCDLVKKEELEKFVRWIYTQVDRVDVLINNAGQFIPGSVHDEPEGAMEALMEANLFTAYHLTRRLLPGMMERKKGHIFNMCSIAALKAYANGGAYSISKFAMLGFTKNLREEMKPYGIKVTAVLPGAAYTDSWAATGIDPERIMEAGDIADIIYASTFLSGKACVEEIVLRPLLGDL